jgi:hypothetical protein
LNIIKSRREFLSAAFAITSTAPRFKFLRKLFSKSLWNTAAAPWSLSAESETSPRRFK